jgi:regulator of chromosome condensation (RCC1) repeat-containing protein
MPGAWRRGWAGGRVTQIAVDPAESAAARSAGTLLTGGGNDKGQLDLGYTKPGATAPRRKHTCPRAGRAEARRIHTGKAGKDRPPGVPGTGGRQRHAVITAPAIPATAATAASRQVAAGQQAAMPMAESPPAVFAWGQDADGQLGDGTTAESDVPVKIPGLTGVTQVAADAESSYALRSDGTVWSWGDNATVSSAPGRRIRTPTSPGRSPA